MTRLALSRIEKRAFVKTTLALLQGCADDPKYRRVVERITRARKRDYDKKRRQGKRP